MWTDHYVGIPFEINGRSRSGVDCWGLVCRVYADRLGIILPDKLGIYADNSRGNLEEVALAMGVEKEKWNEVSDPSDYDVVLMRHGPLACHVGVYVRGRVMLHSNYGCDSVVESVDSIYWRNRIVGYYRHDRTKNTLINTP
ncbi:outer membrane lipoprotein [uncultured Caudovirales phage]|uniref:Outer membrane lipoprotein n=1 Tax=uncultured Caudovirales phage TaxID=2100421 RepID=A0A6J5RNN9_9CAUD|nr:outer membrane lipoprotein [uncultured Caudovirales phage]